jgi:hypothetical protein
VDPQPIETAPDRQRVLLWHADWLHGRDEYWMWSIGKVEGGAAFCIPHPVYRNGAVKVHATHWLPMPARLFGVD